MYAIYLRKSRSDMLAEDEVETLAKHKRTLTELAAKLNLSISKIYSEVVSGESIKARPVVQELLRDVETGMYTGVLVMEVERLARGDTSDQGMIAKVFKYSSTLIITPSKTYDPNDEYDEEYFEFGLFMSRREYKTINRRLQAGRVRSINDGKYVGNVAPFGYDRIPIEGDSGFTLTPNENAKVIQLIYEWYTTGYVNDQGQLERIGVAKIARRLNELGIKPMKRDTFTVASVRDILQNDTYIGNVRWGRRKGNKRMEGGELITSRPRNDAHLVCKGLHDPIISKEVFEKAKYIMSANPAKPIGKRKLTNPLAGLVVCTKCGRKMVRRPYKNSNPSLICPYAECDTVSSALYLVEKRVLTFLEEWVASFESDARFIAPTINNGSSLTESLKRLEVESSEVTSQINKTYELLEKGIYSESIFLERNKILTDQAFALESQISDLSLEIKKQEDYLTSYEIIVPKIKNFLSTYDTCDVESKNNILTELIEHIDYTKEQGGRHTNLQESFVLTIYPRSDSHVYD